MNAAGNCAAQQQVAEITQLDAGEGWSLHAKTGWENAPGPGVGWWVGWGQRGERITPFALNLAMAGAAVRRGASNSVVPACTPWGSFPGPEPSCAGLRSGTGRRSGCTPACSSLRAAACAAVG